MNNIIKHNYNGFQISQRPIDGYVNLTQMCKVGNKLIADWLRLKSTTQYLTALESDMGIPISDLIIVIKGGVPEEQGSWAHKLVAIEVARWISASFAVWSNTHLLELIETGATSLEIIQPSSDCKTRELIEQVTLAFDCIFSKMNIEEALVAGLKLNAIKELVPELASQIEPARQLLINSTAKEHKLLTVTQLGKLLNPPLTAVKTNQLLIAKGYQVKNPNKKSKKDLSYLPTDKAKDHCSVTLATGATKADTYQQLRWYDSIVDLL